MLVFYGQVAGGLGLHVHTAVPGLAETAARIADIGAFGVAIFFVISGYEITGSVRRYSPREFGERRVWRLYPTFLFFVSNRFLGSAPELDQIRHLALNLLFLEYFADTPSLTPNAWSITFEVWYYITASTAFWVESRAGATTLRWPARKNSSGHPSHTAQVTWTKPDPIGVSFTSESPSLTRFPFGLYHRPDAASTSLTHPSRRARDSRPTGDLAQIECGRPGVVPVDRDGTLVKPPHRSRAER